MIAGIKEFYGNRGAIFDFIIALAVTVILLLFKVSLSFLQVLIDGKSDALISFFGVLVGFILTTFSLLFLYNPEHSPDLAKLRKHKSYKKMLHTFISTAFFSVLLTIIFLLVNYIQFPAVLFFLFLFVILRILKCLYYLSVIISLS